MARRIDGPFTNLDVFEIKLSHTSPAALVALLERISQTKKTVLGEKQVGTVLAHPEGGSVLVVAPALERDVWEDLVRRFDRADPVQTLNYSPRRFGVRETSKLVLETLGPQSLGRGLAHGHRRADRHARDHGDAEPAPGRAGPLRPPGGQRAGTAPPDALLPDQAPRRRGAARSLGLDAGEGGAEGPA